ncbi:MAG: hypothetical protein U0325_14230 [Polyangiales bacterium]
MARRDRDRFGGADDERRGGRAPSNGAAPRPPAPAQGPARGPAPAQGASRGNAPRGNAPRPAPPGGPRRPQDPPRPRSIAEDPNAYRSPGFQDVDQNPYKIDYAGLPKDVEEEEGAEAGATETPAPQGPARNPTLPRGMLGRNQDRRGTDPNAYRSPAFHDLDRVHQRFGARRVGRPTGPQAPVRPEGAPADIEETDATPVGAGETPTPTEG